jgi:hypothetical protein
VRGSRRKRKRTHNTQFLPPSLLPSFPPQAGGGAILVERHSFPSPASLPPSRPSSYLAAADSPALPGGANGADGGMEGGREGGEEGIEMSLKGPVGMPVEEGNRKKGGKRRREEAHTHLLMPLPPSLPPSLPPQAKRSNTPSTVSPSPTNATPSF